MKYVSLDLETTSLQPNPNHILMVSMVVEDTSKNVPVEGLPHFTCFVKHERIEGEAYALGMNGWILDYISGRAKNPPYAILPAARAVLTSNPNHSYNNPNWVDEAIKFLRDHFGSEKITVAGKNVAGFDLQFMPSELKKLFRHKVIDPGTMYVDFLKDDQVPNFEECKARAEIDTPVAHDAREDAMDVIRLIRSWEDWLSENLV